MSQQKFHVLWPYYRREGEGKDARVIAEVRAVCDKENRRRRADLLKARFVRVFESRLSGVEMYRDAETGDRVGERYVCQHCIDRYDRAARGEVLR